MPMKEVQDEVPWLCPQEKLVSGWAEAENSMTIANRLQTKPVHMQHMPFLLGLPLLFLITPSLCRKIHKSKQLNVACCVS